jgi:hypothetical protein
MNTLIERLLKDLNETESHLTIPVTVAIKGAFLKHEAFRQEKEWRLLIARYKQVLKHRVRGSLLVPYIKLDLKQELADVLEAVIVGPISHKEQTAQAIKWLLQINGFPSVEVRCSRTPYRGL